MAAPDNRRSPLPLIGAGIPLTLASEDDKSTPRTGGGDQGARAHPHYEDRHEEYILVTKDDLREIHAFGWAQQALLASGTFFFSGAFWLLAELIAHQQMEEHKFEFTAYMGMCVLSIVFGVILAGLALFLYSLREKRLKKYPTRTGE